MQVCLTPSISPKCQILARARLLRRATKAHIRTFNLKSGHASASEAARNQEGDCSEHAALLAALLRADGVASRVCSGLVYTERGTEGDTEGRFAWHAWTQALVGHAWVDLDATLWVELCCGWGMRVTHFAERDILLRILIE